MEKDKEKMPKAKDKMPKRRDKLEAIEKMKPYRFGCKVKLPGLKCVYRSIYLSEMREHVRKHRESIRSGYRTKARYFEIGDETKTIENQVDENISAESQEQESRQLEPNGQKNIIAIFGADNQCVYVPQEFFFKQIDKQFEENIILSNESGDEANENITTSVESLTIMDDVNVDDDTFEAISPSSNPTEQQQQMLSSPVQTLRCEIAPSKQKIDILSLTMLNSGISELILPPIEKDEHSEAAQLTQQKTNVTDTVQLENIEQITILENKPSTNQFIHQSSIYVELFSLNRKIFYLQCHCVFPCAILRFCEPFPFQECSPVTQIQMMNAIYNKIPKMKVQDR